VVRWAFAVYPQSPHDFTLHPTAMASVALEDIESWLADRFLYKQFGGHC
jgi:hypothetical protein